MAEFNVIAKGNYQYEQTSDILRIDRFLLLRKKKRRMLLFDMRNLGEQPVTGFTLEVEQFDARGNLLGVTETTLKKQSFKTGGFILKKPIAVHPFCLDFKVRFTLVECGEFVYRLGNDGVYATYEKKKKRAKLNASAVTKKTGKDGYAKEKRRFSAPKFVGIFCAILLGMGALFTGIQLDWFKNNRTDFFLDNLQYEFVDASETGEGAPVRITGYIGLGGTEIYVPNKIESHPVIEISDYAFMNDNDVRKVTIAENVVVTQGAFSGCQSLETVVLEGYNEIRPNAFENCFNLKNVRAKNLLTIGAYAFYNASSLKSVRIESDEDFIAMLTIESGAFSAYAILDEIRIDEYVYYGETCNWFENVLAVDSLYLKNFNDSVYASGKRNDRPISAIFNGESGYNTVNIKSITIGTTDSIPAGFTSGINPSALESVRIDAMKTGEIGENAFHSCSNLTTLKLAKNIEKVGAYAFYNTGITSFEATALKSIGDGAFSYCVNLTDFSLTKNSTLQSVGIEAFSNCENITELRMPATVESLGAYAFSGAKRLKSVNFDAKSKISLLDAAVFSDCVALQTVKLPASLEVIGTEAFNNCRSLREVSIPAKVHAIDPEAFRTCYKLFEIENLSSVELIAGTAPAQFALKVYNSASEPRAEKLSISGCSFMKVDGAWTLLDYVGTATVLTLPAYIDGNENTPNFGYTIHDYFLLENTTLKSLVIPDTVRSLGTWVAYHSALETVRFASGESPLTIRAGVFEEATALEKVDFGSRGLEKIEQGAFVNCMELKEIALSHLTLGVGEYAFYCSQNLERVTGGNALQTIGDYAFADCGALQSYAFPSTLQTIGNGAFSGCSKLESSVKGESLLSIGDRAFENCNALSTVSLPNGFTGLGLCAFSNCGNLRTVELPDTLTAVPENAFSDCVKLSSLQLPNTVETIGNNAFLNCKKLGSLYLPTNLKMLGDYAFYGCEGLEFLYLSDSLAAIGMNAFEGCTSLVSVVNGNALQRIEQGAFASCKNLREFPFGEAWQLQYIGSSAFAECTALTSISFPSSLQTIGSYAFYNCTGLEQVELPASLTTIDYEAFSGCKYLHEVRNGSPLSIVVNDTSNGMVAYNALVVLMPTDNKPLESGVTSDGFCFKSYAGAYWLVGYEGSGTEIKLGTFNDPNHYNRKISSYTVARYAFENSKIKKLTLTDAVTEIKDNAFNELNDLKFLYLDSTFTAPIVSNAFMNCYNLKTFVFSPSCERIEDWGINGAYGMDVYFEGSQDVWYENAGKYILPPSNLYTYVECIHYDYQWNYKNGEINTTKKSFNLKEITQNPTCSKEGNERHSCSVCKVYEDYWLAPLGHSYTEGECVNCGHINYMPFTQKTQKKLQKLFTLTNDEKLPYDLFKTDAEKITVKVNAGEKSTLVLKAKETVNVTLAIEVAEGCSLIVYEEYEYDGWEKAIVGEGKTYLELTVEAGQTILIVYKNESGENGATVTLEEMFVTAVNEPVQDS